MRTLLCILLLSSCVSTTPQIIEKERSLSPFPPIVVSEYTRKPIIESKENNFVVTDEFVTNSLKLKSYKDRVDSWKKLNNIK
jgi:hypothetical protein